MNKKKEAITHQCMKTIKEYLNEGLIRRQAGMDVRVKIEAWLKEYNIKNYTIKKDLTIDVNRIVKLQNYKEKRLPNYIQFGKTESWFFYNCPNLESLEGCPKEVETCIWISDCPNLESLEGCPKEVGEDFVCHDCPKLTSLQGAPQNVGNDFWCGGCGKRFTIEDVEEVSNVKGKITAVK